MSTAIKILQGKFGRVALLDMSKPLVTHAHHHCHALIKVSGPDTFFLVRNRLQPLTDHSAVLVNAWEPHAYAHLHPEDARPLLLALYIEPKWLGGILHPLSVSSHPQFFPQPCVLLPPNARRLALALATDMLAHDELPAMQLEDRLFDLFIALIEHHSEWNNFNDLLRAWHAQPTDARIQRAIRHMRSHLSESLDLVQLAAQCGLSRAHFFDLFRRTTHVTPMVYLNVLRFEAAVQALTATQANLAQISYDIGFSAPGHFTRFFREQLGITPSEYRRVVDVKDFSEEREAGTAQQILVPRP